MPLKKYLKYVISSPKYLKILSYIKGKDMLSELEFICVFIVGAFYKIHCRVLEEPTPCACSSS